MSILNDFSSANQGFSNCPSSSTVWSSLASKDQSSSVKWGSIFLFCFVKTICWSLCLLEKLKFFIDLKWEHFKCQFHMIGLIKWDEIWCVANKWSAWLVGLGFLPFSPGMWTAIIVKLRKTSWLLGPNFICSIWGNKKYAFCYENRFKLWGYGNPRFHTPWEIFKCHFLQNGLTD